jgi:hypothetical protein
MRNAVPSPRLDEDLLDFLCKPPVVDPLLDAAKANHRIIADVKND